MKKRKKNNEKKTIALSQIVLLIVGIFATSFIIGNSLPVVSADGGGWVLGPGIKAIFAFFKKNIPLVLKAAWNFLMTSPAKGLIALTAEEGALGLGTYITGYFLMSILAAAAGAAVVYGIFAIFSGERNLKMLLPGAMVSAGATALISTVIALFVSGPPAWVLAVIAAGLTAIWAGMTFQEFAQEKIVFLPGAWMPATLGDNDCEKCNSLEYGCSEYQCRTFGKECVIINENTQEQICVQNRSTDYSPPIISPLEDKLQHGFKYVPLVGSEGMESPPSRGVKVVVIEDGGKENDKIPPYVSLTLGVKTNKPSECRMDIKRRDNFSEMLFSIGKGGYAGYEHPFTVPSSALVSRERVHKSFYGDGSDLDEEYINLLEGLNLDEANDYDLYIRCRGLHGIPSIQDFVIKIMVDDGPDTKAPEILYTNYAGKDGGSVYVSYDAEHYPISVTTNEPATCRWDKNNVDYKDMSNEIPNCEEDGLGQYTCSGGQLTGVENGKDNTFYIKCQDKPNWKEGDFGGIPYANAEPYVLTLKGTGQPLEISKIYVNEKENGSIIKGSTEFVNLEFKITTIAGANNGKSICFYGNEEGKEIIQFYNKGETGFFSTNVQPNLALGEGKYDYYFKCIDEGGNEAKGSISFTVDVDKFAPKVIRAYKKENLLQILTDENAVCVYSNSVEAGCTYSFEDGTKMTSLGSVHTTSWKNDKTFYIKCKDEFENQPAISDCSIVVKPFSIQ